MTYNVFGGTLSLTQSINQSYSMLAGKGDVGRGAIGNGAR